MGRPLGANRINDFFMGKKSVSKLNEAYEMSGGKVLTPNGRNSNSFKAKSTFTQGTPKRGAYPFSSGSSKGRSSPFFGGGTGATHNTAPKLYGTNYHINTRGTTAFTKGLGGAAITKAGMTYSQAFVKYGPLGLGALLFFDIVLADQGLASGELPEHIRNPGEKQDIGLGDFTFSPEAIERDSPLYLFGTYKDQSEEEKYWRTVGTVKPSSISSPAPQVRNERWEIPYVDTALGGSRLVSISKYQYDIESRHRPYSFEMIHTTDHKGRTSWRFGKTTTVKTSPNGNSGREKLETESATNHSNIPTPQRATSDNPPPPSIRPPFPSNETASPTPSKSFERPSSTSSPSKPPVVKKANTGSPPSALGDVNNDERPRVEVPAAVNTPAPKPPPPSKQSTIGDNPNAGKRANFGKQKADGEEVEDTKIISETTRMRADGVIETVIQREATPEEIEEYNRTIKNAEEVNERERIKQGLRESYPDLVEDLDSDTEKDGSVVKKVKRRTKREGKSSPSSVPEPGSNDKVSKTSEPDASSPTPQSEPKPVIQNKSIDDPIKDKIDKLPSKKDIALIVGGLDIIQQIAKKAGTASPVCLAPALVPPVSAC